jgi:putative PIN family toxin of toxin-antitoxin system
MVAMMFIGKASGWQKPAQASELSLPSLAVLDTNIVLDLFVYSDARQATLDKALRAGELQWLATSAMRAELARVLDYPQVAKRRLVNKQSSDDVLAQMDSLATYVDAAPKAPYTCKDPDDQIFIDLACQHRCVLLSKDKAVLAMRSRLARLGTIIAHHYTETS